MTDWEYTVTVIDLYILWMFKIMQPWDIPYSGKFLNGVNFRIFQMLAQYMKTAKIWRRKFKSRVTFDLHVTVLTVSLYSYFPKAVLLDVFADMVTSHYRFHWRRCHLHTWPKRTWHNRPAGCGMRVPAYSRSIIRKLKIWNFIPKGFWSIVRKFEPTKISRYTVTFAYSQLQ